MKTVNKTTYSLTLAFTIFAILVTAFTINSVMADDKPISYTVTCSGSGQKSIAYKTEAEARASFAKCKTGAYYTPRFYIDTRLSSSASQASSSAAPLPVPDPVKPTPVSAINFESGNLLTDKGSPLSWNDSTYTGVKSITSRTGEPTKALQFNYQAGEFWSEQRFTLAKAYPEIWIRYWLQVPTNFKHNQPKGATNNKLFALFMDDYSNKGKGPTVIWEFWANGKNGSDLAVHYSEGNNTIAGEHLQLKPFIAYPADQGKWMQIVLHVKSGKQGAIEFYRRWNGEPTFTRLHNVTNVNLPAPANGPAGWKQGYFMGWSNPAYAATTVWNLDDVEISDTSLVE